MTNLLKKKTSITVLPEQVAQAAVPYRPAQPAYTSTSTQHICRLEYVTVGAVAAGPVKVVDATTGNITYRWEAGSPGKTSQVRICEDVTTTTYHPAVPEQPARPAVAYRPAYVTKQFKLGWNAGARSVQELVGNGAATFSVPSAVGAVVGLSGVDGEVGYLSIAHGFYLRRQTFTVMEFGVSKTPDATFAASDVFKIERIGGQVRYFRNGGLVYASQVQSTGAVFLDASLYSGGDSVDSPALIAASGGYSRASMRPLGGFASDKPWAYSRGEMLPMTGAASALKARSHAAMRPLTGVAVEGKYGSSRASMAPMVGTAAAWALAPGYGLSAGMMAPMGGGAFGPQQRYGSSNAVMYPMTGMAVEGKYGGSRASMAPMGGYAADAAFTQPPRAMPKPSMAALGGASAPLGMPRPVFNAYAAPSLQNVAQMDCPAWGMTATAGAGASVAMPRALLDASATTTLRAEAAMTGPAATLDASATASLMGQANLTFAGTYALVGYAGALVSATIGVCTLQADGTGGIEGTVQIALPLYELDASASLESVAQAELVAPAMAATPWAVAWMAAPAARMTAIGTAVVAVTHEAYAVNLHSDLENGGNEVTRYTNYPFERIVRWRGSYYGMAADGLYLLEGATDDGRPIGWAVRTGTTDFGKAEKKNTASAYVGGRLGPAATFTVFTGEKRDDSYAYTTPRGASAQNYRQKFGRGLDARYYAFGLSGTGELEIDDLDIEVVSRARRRV